VSYYPPRSGDQLLGRETDKAGRGGNTLVTGEGKKT